METLKKVESLFKIAGDYTRLKIMESLLDESLCTCSCENCGDCLHHHCMIKKCVNDIASDINASQSLVSHQLKVLKDFNLVTSFREGNKMFYSLKDGHIKQLIRISIEHIKEGEQND